MSPAKGTLSATRRSGMIERVTSLLDAVREAGDPPSYTEIAAATSLPLSTTYRLLSTLVAQSWLAVNDSGGYTLGQRSIRLGQAGSDPAVVRSASSEELLELSWRTEGVAHLAVLDRAQVHYLDKVGDNGLYHQVASAVGAREPACFTSSGQVLLNSCPPTWVLCPHAEDRYATAHQDRLLRAMDQIRVNEGVRVIPAQRHPFGYANVAAPISGSDGAVAAISVATMTADIDRIVSLVQEAAQRISYALFAAQHRESMKTHLVRSG